MFALISLQHQIGLTLVQFDFASGSVDFSVCHIRFTSLPQIVPIDSERIPLRKSFDACSKRRLKAGASLNLEGRYYTPSHKNHLDRSRSS